MPADPVIDSPLKVAMPSALVLAVGVPPSVRAGTLEHRGDLHARLCHRVSVRIPDLDPGLVSRGALHSWWWARAGSRS